MRFHIQEFKKLQAHGRKEQVTQSGKWNPPPELVYKLNVDGAFLAGKKSGGWGFVLRDYTGSALETGAGSVPVVADALQAETIAALQGMELVAYWGMSRIILETGASNLGNAITSNSWDNSPSGSLFRSIRGFLD